MTKYYACTDPEYCDYYDAVDCAQCDNFECESHKNCFEMIYGDDEMTNECIKTMSNEFINVIDDGILPTIDVKELAIVTGYFVESSDCRAKCFTDKTKGTQMFKSLIYKLEDDDRINSYLQSYYIRICNRIFNRGT